MKIIILHKNLTTENKLYFAYVSYKTYTTSLFNDLISFDLSSPYKYKFRYLKIEQRYLLKLASIRINTAPFTNLKNETWKL